MKVKRFPKPPSPPTSPSRGVDPRRALRYARQTMNEEHTESGVKASTTPSSEERATASELEQKVRALITWPCDNLTIDEVLEILKRSLDNAAAVQHFGLGAPPYEADHGIDEEQHAWLEKLAVSCRCCAECTQVPCGGCQQGAPCDARGCDCERDYDMESDQNYESVF